MLQPDTEHKSQPDSIHGTFVLGSTIEDCSVEACRIWSRKPEAIVGNTLETLSPEHQPDGTLSSEGLETRLQAARAGMSQAFEWQFVRADGAPIDTLVYVESSEIGGRYCLRGRIRDVTFLNHAENALRDSETRLQQIVNNSTAVVYVKDREGRFLLINKQFQNLFHIREEDIIGRRDEDVFPAEIAATFRANDQQVLNARRAIEFEETAQLDDGTHISFRQIPALHCGRQSLRRMRYFHGHH